jgi:hypothetical protein
MKNIVTLALAGAVTLGAASQPAAQAQIPVSTAGELAAIGQNEESLAGSYVLTNDLTLENWIPVGGIDDRDGKGFCGTFDGSGHTVTITGFGDIGGGIAVGLFGAVEDEGVIKNLRVTGDIGYTATRKNLLHIGGIAGLNRGKIMCCCADIALKGEVRVTGKGEKVKGLYSYETGVYCGGIAGVNIGLVNDCHSAGSVSASGGVINIAGGIAGGNGQLTKGGFGIGAGPGGVGVSVSAGDMTVTDAVGNCYSTASVSADSAEKGGLMCIAGGIAGRNYTTGTVQYCVALNGEVTANGNSNLFSTPISVMMPYIAPIAFNSFYDRDMVITRYKNGKPEKPRGYAEKNAVALSTMQEQSWWSYPDGLTPKERLRRFGFSFGGDETAPWVWNEQDKRPVLYWEQ